MTGGDGLVLAIETSCDETAAAVVEGGRTILSSVVSSQVGLHERFGGVVPEIAGRAHVEQIVPVVGRALADAGFDPTGRPLPATGREGRVGAVAATTGPGLVGALLVGVSFAKALALAWDVPFVGVNHLEGHLYASLLEEPGMALPVVVLLVSGGHSLLVVMHGPRYYEVLGETVDDAAGEAFDKVARFLDLGYPGGPAVEHAASGGDSQAVPLPRPMLAEGLDMSFSGLKTAVVQFVTRHPDVRTPDVAAAFQEAVVDVLVHKTLAAARAVGARGVCLAGGVAANGRLRERTVEACEAEGLPVFLPSRAMCTDNAAMIAAAGHVRLASDGSTSIGAGAEPSARFPVSPP